MTLKFSKILICLIAVMCLFSSSVTAFAENGDLDFDFNIQPEVPTTQEQTIPVETEKETDKETQKETEKQTEKQTTEKVTQTPTKPRPTQSQDRPVNNNSQNDVQATEKTTKEETTLEEFTDEHLPDGAFYVYLERNNGQRRLTTILNKPGYVPPPDEPFRTGYVFAGWYSDPEFTKPWDFYKDKANKQMTIYAKWRADEGTVVYDIIIEEAVGGKLEVNPRKASFGEPVVITVTADEGKRLVQGSLLINGEPTDFLSFIMPKGKVTISASFEDVPENENVTPEKSKAPLFISIGVVAVIILAFVIVIAKKRHDFNADLDENEESYADAQDYYDDWIDETIVVEDGFKEGKKVVENTEPDYGAPDVDEDDLD